MSKHRWEYAVAQAACQSMAGAVLEMDVSDVVIPDSLQERVSKLFHEEAQRLARRRLIRRRVAIAIVAAVVAALTACMVIPGIREKLYQIVVTDHDRYFSYQSKLMDVDEGDGGGAATSDNVTATPFVRKMPSYLPEGYVLHENLQKSLMVRTFFLNPKTGSILCYEQYPVGTSQYLFNSKGVDVETILIDGHPGIMTTIETNGVRHVTLLWNDDRYDYYIHAPLSVDETVKIAESIS
ncbi:MAG: DUF4367 domain-containing protein [Ruminococcaceae bacterium]|nr:DUF4367 domain-containing protein [Oscillospiraceae bacterium]